MVQHSGCESSCRLPLRPTRVALPTERRNPSLLEAGGSASKTAEERYRKIFQYNNDAVMVVDLETESVLDVNPAACDLLGYSREELLSMHPEEIHPNDVERVREEFISQISRDGSGFTDDLTCLTKDGEEVPTEISGAALDAGENGTDPTRMIAMLRDVSDRVEHRRELEEPSNGWTGSHASSPTT